MSKIERLPNGMEMIPYGTRQELTDPVANAKAVALYIKERYGHNVPTVPWYPPAGGHPSPSPPRGVPTSTEPKPLLGAYGSASATLALVPGLTVVPPRRLSCSAFDALSAEEKVMAVRAVFGRMSRGAVEIIHLSRYRLRARRMAATLDEIEWKWPDRLALRFRERRPFDGELD